MPNRIRRWFMVMVMALSAMHAFAQTPYFLHHKIIKGLRGYDSQVIYQDRQGFMWFGTSEGLVRFDGVDYLRYTTADSLAGNSVTAICESTDGTLWLGHENGLITLMKDGSFSKFDPEEGLGTIEITDLRMDTAGIIWFTTMGEGVYYYMNNRLYNLSMDDGLADDYTYCVEPGPGEKIYIGTDFGISIYDPDSKEFDQISMSDGIPDNIIKKIVYNEGKIWAGTDEAGIFHLDPETLEPFIMDNWSFGSITDFIINSNEIWVSTERSGVVQVIMNEDGTIRNKLITTRQGLHSDRTQSIFLDREKNLWIGSRDNVTQSITSVFEFLDGRHGLPANLMVYDFLMDENQFYWICSNEGLFKLTESMDGGFDVVKLFTGTALEYHTFISLFADTDSYIWAGTYDQGVFRIDPATLDYLQFTTAHGLSDNNVISITASGRRIYFSTLGGGVSVCEIGAGPIVIKNITLENPEISNYIYSTYIDSRDRIWFAESGDRIHCLHGDSLTGFGSEEGLRFNTVYSVTEDQRQNIYFSTERDGIYCATGSGFTHFDETSGLSSSEIRSIMADPYDNILVVSNMGIDLFRPESKSFTHFGEQYGVAYIEPQLNSIYRDEQGHIWIGTGQGVIKYNPHILHTDTIEPLLFLSDIELYSVPVEAGKTRFSHKQNHFTFRYTGLWFQDPGQLRYRFRLDGYDTDWSVSTANRVMTYPRVPPGTYTFEVEASLDGKRWKGSGESSFSFTVRPPFWRTWWFITFSVVATLLIILAIFRIRLAALKAQKEELEREVLKATEEIRNKNEELEARKNEIEAQRDLVMEQRDRIEHQQEELQSSIRYAHRIQTAVRTPHSIIRDLIRDYFILDRPRDIVSGDFYWVAAKEKHIFFAAADCTGHGVPGAFMSMLGIAGFNEILAGHCGVNADGFLGMLREHIKKALHHTGEEGDAMDGMDVALCIIDESNLELSFAGANNPLYLIRNNELIEYKGDKMPIGWHTRDKEPFTEHRIQLEKGDCLYIFSDGYPDQFGGEKGKKFMYKSLKKLLLEIHQEPMAEQEKILDDRMMAWKGTHDQVDDIIVMGICI
jgi:ligand-binding sensor domain-containing protein/serine phosphatase RsbU (regulator of sigma subunit)